MSAMISGADIAGAFKRVADALEDQRSYLTELDQAMGDGDLGITAGKIAVVLRNQATNPSDRELGKYISQTGMEINRAASSTMGTLIATALMRAGKTVQDVDALTPHLLVEMLRHADQGIQDRGKAKPGDKTIVDAIHPSADAFARAIGEGKNLIEAGDECLAAAQAGLERVTPLRSKIGRAGWIGERTEGKVDPGCALWVIVLEALLGIE